MTKSRTNIHFYPPSSSSSLSDFQILSQVDTPGSAWVDLVGLLGLVDLVDLVGLLSVVDLVGLIGGMVGLQGLAACVDLDPAGHPGPPTLNYSCLLTYNDRFKPPALIISIK